MKTWEKDFKPRFDVLPRDRKFDTVRQVREIIKEMHQEGYSSSEISRCMEYKDHTTVVYHLAYMGFKPRLELQQRMRPFYEMKEKEAKERLERRKKDQKGKKKLQAVKLKISILYQARKKEIDEEKRIAKSLYSQGISYLDIAKQLNCSIDRTQYLIFYGKEKTIRRRGWHEIIQYSLTGKEIAYFPSIRSAAKATGVPHTDISHALNDGRYKSAKGFKWKYNYGTT